MRRITIFKERHKPQEVVRVLKDNFSMLEKGEKKNADKILEEISKYLSVMKGMLYGTADQDPQTELVASLSQEIYQSHLLLVFINQLHRVTFEDKKDIAHIFNNLLRRQIGKIHPTVDYLLNHVDIINKLLHGYEDPEVALHCGAMLRECCRHESLTKHILSKREFFNFFIYVELSTFDIASDAFSTFRELLSRHRAISATFLEANYTEFFSQYEKLLLSENYVTRRQSLKLLGELLLYRSNFSIMARYISNPDNLKLMMNLFREKSSHIQFEAFHVFKVFVANPNKPKAIADILIRNRDKLIDFLTAFNSDRTDDEQFCDEKAYLIKQIKDLKESQETSSGGATSQPSLGSGVGGGQFASPSSSPAEHVTSMPTASQTASAKVMEGESVPEKNRLKSPPGEGGYIERINNKDVWKADKISGNSNAGISGDGSSKQLPNAGGDRKSPDNAFNSEHNRISSA